MGFYITRQVRIDGSHIVEITYDKLAINSDLLRSDYKGESELYDDPEAAAETAILIRGLWQRDEPDKNITMAVGSAAGYYPMDAGELRQWAGVELDTLPRCAWCGEIIYNSGVQYVPRGEAHASLFCSMACVMEFEDDDGATEAARAADRELKHAEDVTRRDIEFAEEHRQNL